VGREREQARSTTPARYRAYAADELTRHDSWVRVYRAGVRAVLIAALVASPAVAAATPVTLRYEAPDRCPSASAFRAGVDSRTPRANWVTPDQDQDATVLEVVLDLDDSGASGRLIVKERGRPPAAPRVVTDATCATVVDALALVAALAIDPQASLSPTLPGIPEPSDAPDPPPEPAEPPPLSDRPTRPPARGAAPPDEQASWRWSLGAQVGLSSALGQGSLQVVPLHADLRRFDAAWSPSARLGFSVLVPSEMVSPFGKARVLRYAGQLTLCPAGLDIETFRFAPCAGVEIGMFQAEGLEVDQARTARELWAAALITVRTSARLGGPVLLDVEASVAVPVTRPRVIIEPDHLVVEAAPAAAILAAGLAVELP
jgi:hypothetical protein